VTRVQTCALPIWGFADNERFRIQDVISEKIIDMGFNKITCVMQEKGLK
jgi:hypothetical protein